MISKESAHEISDEILDSESKTQNLEISTSERKRYNLIFGSELVERHRDTPGVFKEALKYSHSRWQVLLSYFIFIAALCSLYYFDTFSQKTTLFILVLVGVLSTEFKLTKYYGRQYLLSIQKNA